jgi:hypothetical protein
MPKDDATNRDLYEKLEEIRKLMSTQLSLFRLINEKTIETALSELLRTDTEKMVYESSDGHTSREIAQMVGISHMTVINYWKKWARYDIVKETSSRGGTRFLKIFSLADFGIEAPRILTKEKVVEREPTEQILAREAQGSEKSEIKKEGV